MSQTYDPQDANYIAPFPGDPHASPPIHMGKYGDLPPERARLLLKLESIAELGREDIQALLEIPLRLKDLPADTDIVREREKPSECCLVIDGFVCRFKIVLEGKRQILSFHTPGDIPDLQSLYLHTMDHTLGTLVASKLAFIAHRDMLELIRRYPKVGAAFWRDTLIDAAIFREWMVGIGRRSAYQRIAHLICEMAMRFKAVGLTDGHTFQFPITQAELGDALGLSFVHANRTLMDLRGDGLISWQNAKVTILDWEGLRRAGDFDPGYLHQNLKRIE
jgi:CRP-like cAMP-binding protein